MYTLLSFLISVTANVVAIYMGKWIDGNNERK